jgi:hypothetical protein
VSDHPIDLDHLARQLAGGAHSIFAPSGSYGWLHCAGYILANLGKPDDAGYDAAYGTVGHAVAERWLKTGERPDDLIGQVEIIANEIGDEFWVQIDEEMLRHVWEYVRRCQDEPGEHYIEQKVYFSQLTPIPKQGGTADFFAILGHRLKIRDLKLGQGVKVFAEKNPQEMLYALGVVYAWDWLYGFDDEIVIEVDQPRLDHFDSWTTTKAELFEFAEFVRERAAAAWTLNAPRRPSEAACRFCKAKKGCAAHIAWLGNLRNAIADDTFEDLDREYTQTEMVSATESFVSNPNWKFPPANELSIEAKRKLLLWREMVEDFFRSVHKDLERQVIGRELTIEGFELYESVTRRVFKNVKAARVALIQPDRLTEDEFFKKNPITPRQAETKLRAKGFKPKEIAEIISPVVYKPPGKLTLAPVSKGREPASDIVDDTFTDLDLIDGL